MTPSTEIYAIPKGTLIGGAQGSWHAVRPPVDRTTCTQRARSPAPPRGVCGVPGHGAISSNDGKHISVIGCHAVLHWHSQRAGPVTYSRLTASLEVRHSSPLYWQTSVARLGMAPLFPPASTPTLLWLLAEMDSEPTELPNV